MRIAFITPSLANKGPILVAKELISNLAKLNVKCELYYFDNIVELEVDCPVYQIKFTDKIDFEKFDIIHCHAFRPDCWGFMWSLKYNIKGKLTTTLHNYFKEDLSYSYSKIKATIGAIIWQLMWTRFAKATALTHSAKKYYRSYINETKLNVIYNGKDILNEDIVEEDKIQFSTLRDKGFTIIGTVASFNARKGLEQIINVLTSIPNFAFIIVGDGPEKENLINLANSLKVADRVIFLGSRDKGYRYHKYFDIFTIPSRAEGLPLSLIEAVSQKVPVVCSDIEVFNELFTEEEVSFFELDNLSSLKKAILRSYSNKEYLVEEAYKHYQRELTAECMTNNYLKLYKAMSGNN